jgi:hypothetical protein
MNLRFGSVSPRLAFHISFYGNFRKNVTDCPSRRFRIKSVVETEPNSQHEKHERRFARGFPRLHALQRSGDIFADTGCEQLRTEHFREISRQKRAHSAARVCVPRARSAGPIRA